MHQILAKRSYLKKTIALLVASTFIFSNIALGEIVKTDNTATNTQKPQEIVTNPEKIVIPRDYGLVKSKYEGKDKRLVIHIQDAHCNYEAQSNIAKILETLIKNDGLNLVSVEGADGVIDTSWFKAFPDADIRKEVADYFMKKGEITGAEFLSITTDYPIKLFGAETRSYYIENLNAFTSSYPLKEDTEKYFNQIKSILNKLKNTIYSEELKNLDAKIQDYEAKKLQFADYVKALEAMAVSHKINLRQYSSLFKLISVFVYEKKINFNIVDKERSALIDEITKKLDKEALADLVTRSLSFKTGKISSAEYYDYLRNLATHHGFELAKDYPNLFNYIIYNSVYSRIENEKLFKDLKDLELAVKEKLFANDDQRTLEKLSRHIDILLGLTNIKLLNGDFDYYKSNKEGFSHEAFAGFINKMAAKYGFSFELDTPSDAVTESIPKLEDFYSIAIKRDKALVDNTLQAMKKDGARICVLITGGFHSEGIAKMLEHQGMSYMVVCPNITKEVETPYIKILTNQRTPLEEILTDTASEPQAKGGSMLAPMLLTCAGPLDEKHIRSAFSDLKSVDSLVGRLSDGKKNWERRSVESWIAQTMKGAQARRLPHDIKSMKAAYIFTMRTGLIGMKTKDKGGRALSGAEITAIDKFVDGLTKSDNFDDIFAGIYDDAFQKYVVSQQPSEAAMRATTKAAADAKVQQFMDGKIRDDKAKKGPLDEPLTNEDINNELKLSRSQGKLVEVYRAGVINPKAPKHYSALVSLLIKTLEQISPEEFTKALKGKPGITNTENLRPFIDKQVYINELLGTGVPEEDKMGILFADFNDGRVGIAMSESGSNYGHFSVGNHNLYIPAGLIKHLIGMDRTKYLESFEKRLKQGKVSDEQIFLNEIPLCIRQALADIMHELTEYTMTKHFMKKYTEGAPVRPHTKPLADMIAREESRAIRIIDDEVRAHIVAQYIEVLFTGHSERFAEYGFLSKLDDVLSGFSENYIFEARRREFLSSLDQFDDELKKLSDNKIRRELSEALKLINEPYVDSQVEATNILTFHLENGDEPTRSLARKITDITGVYVIRSKPVKANPAPITLTKKELECIQDRYPFEVKDLNDFLHLREVFKTAVLKGHIKPTVIINIKNITGKTDLAYAKFLRAVSEKYNGNITFVLSVEDPVKLKHDWPGMVTADLRMLSVLGTDYYKDSLILQIPDGGFNTRNANITLRFEQNGKVPVPGSQAFIDMNIDTVGSIAMLYPGMGYEDRLMIGSDNALALGEVRFNGNRQLKDLPKSREITQWGVDVEVLTVDQAAYLTRRVTDLGGWEKIINDYKKNGDPEKGPIDPTKEWLAEKLLDDPNLAEVRQNIRDEKLTGLGLFAVDGGKINWFGEKPDEIYLLEAACKYGRHILKNMFLTGFNKKFDLDLIKRAGAEPVYDVLVKLSDKDIEEIGSIVRELGEWATIEDRRSKDFVDALKKSENPNLNKLPAMIKDNLQNSLKVFNFATSGTIDIGSEENIATVIKYMVEEGEGYLMSFQGRHRSDLEVSIYQTKIQSRLERESGWMKRYKYDPERPISPMDWLALRDEADIFVGEVYGVRVGRPIGRVEDKGIWTDAGNLALTGKMWYEKSTDPTERKVSGMNPFTRIVDSTCSDEVKVVGHPFLSRVVIEGNGTLEAADDVVIENSVIAITGGRLRIPSGWKIVNCKLSGNADNIVFHGEGGLVIGLEFAPNTNIFGMDEKPIRKLEFFGGETTSMLSLDDGRNYVTRVLTDLLYKKDGSLGLIYQEVGSKVSWGRVVGAFPHLRDIKFEDVYSQKLKVKDVVGNEEGWHRLANIEGFEYLNVMAFNEVKDREYIEANYLAWQRLHPYILGRNGWNDKIKLYDKVTGRYERDRLFREGQFIDLCIMGNRCFDDAQKHLDSLKMRAMTENLVNEIRQKNTQHVTADFVSPGMMPQPAVSDGNGQGEERRMSSSGAIREKSSGKPLGDELIDAVIRDDSRSDKLVIFENGSAVAANCTGDREIYKMIPDILKERISNLQDSVFKDILKGETEDIRIKRVFTKERLLKLLEPGSNLRMVLVQPKEKAQGPRIPAIAMTGDGYNYGHYSTKNDNIYAAWGAADALLSTRSKEDLYKMAALFAHELAEYLILKFAFPKDAKVTVLDRVDGLGRQAHFIAQYLEREIAGPSKNDRESILGPRSALDDTLGEYTLEYLMAKHPITLAEAYTSPANFQFYVAGEVAKLAKAVPLLEGMIAGYREVRDVERRITESERRLEVALKAQRFEEAEAYGARLEEDRKRLAKARPAMLESILRDVSASTSELKVQVNEIKSRGVEPGREAQIAANLIDALIRVEYNSKVVKEAIGYDFVGSLSENDVVMKLPTLAEFRKRDDYKEWRKLAVRMMTTGRCGFIDLFAGAASRLLGTQQDRDSSLSYFAHDVYEAAKKNDVPLDINRIEGTVMGTRFFVQAWLDFEAILTEYYSSLNIYKTPEDIVEERKQVQQRIPRLVLINPDSGKSIIEEIVNNDFYGYKPELVIFVMQPTYRGFDIVDNVPTLVKNSLSFPAGHGDATMQTVESGRCFWVDKLGRVNMIDGSAFDYLRERERIAAREGGPSVNVDLLIEGRVNDMLRYSYAEKYTEAQGIPNWSIDMDILALSLSQMASSPDKLEDLEDLSKGKNAVLEMVGQSMDPDKQVPGSSPLKLASGKQFLVETLAQHPRVAELVGKMGVPFNRFFIVAKQRLLPDVMKKHGLPVYIRFRDGFLYPETVTGDLTMLDGANAGYAIDHTRRITDYKDIKTLATGLAAARVQDQYARFVDYVSELRATARRVSLEGLGKIIEEAHAPDMLDLPSRSVSGSSVIYEVGGARQNGTGAIRARGGELTAEEHGARQLGTLEKFNTAATENTFNGVVRKLILDGKAYSLVPYGLREGDVDIKIKHPPVEDAGATSVGNLIKLINIPWDFNLVVIKGLKEELKKQGVAEDVIFHPGVTRKSVYMDEEDLKKLLSLSNGVALIEEAINHELTHIANPSLSETYIEKMSPTKTVKAALVEDGNFNIEGGGRRMSPSGRVEDAGKYRHPDREDFEYILSLPNRADLEADIVKHKKEHADNPSLSEDAIEVLAPSHNVRLALLTKVWAKKDVRELEKAYRDTYRRVVENGEEPLQIAEEKPGYKYSKDIVEALLDRAVSESGYNKIKAEMYRSVIKNTPEAIRNNPLVDLSNKGAMEIVFTKENLPDFDAAKGTLKGMNLQSWLKQYKKEASASTAGIRGAQNIFWPNDGRELIGEKAIILATAAKALVARDLQAKGYPDSELHKLASCEVRYNSKEYVELIARIQAALGIKTHITADMAAMPIWMASFLIFKYDLFGGEYVTSSHAISKKTATKDLNDQGSQYIPDESSLFVAKIEEIIKIIEDKGSFTIKLAPMNSPLIDESFMARINNGVDDYVEYLRKGIATRSNLKLINDGKKPIYIDVVGGSMYRTMSKVFDKLGIAGRYKWLHTAEDPYFHGIGKACYRLDAAKDALSLEDLSCDTSIIAIHKPESAAAISSLIERFKDRIAEKDIDTQILIPVPDSNDKIYAQVRSENDLPMLKKLGVDFVSIDLGGNKALVIERNERILPVIRTMGYRKSLKSVPVGTVFLLTDPDGDRLITAQIASSKDISSLKAMGVAYEILDENRVFVVFIPNQSFLMTADFRKRMLKESGDWDKYDWFMLKTTASAASWDDWAAAQTDKSYKIMYAGTNEWVEVKGIPVVNGPVGFKELAAMMKKIEKQMREHPGQDVIIEDIFGNKINLGSNPRNLFSGEESGGEIFGPTQLIESINGRKAVSMREKSAGEAMVITSAIAAYLESRNITLLDYLEEIFENNRIVNKFDYREDIVYFNESEPDPVVKKKAADEGIKLKEENDFFYLAIAIAVRDGKISFEEAKAFLQKTFPSVDFTTLRKIFFVGDGTYLKFDEMILEIRPSGTEAKTKGYALGNKVQVLIDSAKAMAGYYNPNMIEDLKGLLGESLHSEYFKVVKFMGTDVPYVKARAMKIYNEYLAKDADTEPFVPPADYVYLENPAARLSSSGVSENLHTVLNAHGNAEMAARFLKGGYKQDGYGVEEGAAIDGSFAIGSEGNQGYYVDGTNVRSPKGELLSGEKVFVKTVNDMGEFFLRREQRLGKEISYVIKPGIGGQHTPFQGIADTFEVLNVTTGKIVGEYELGKDYEKALSAVLKELNAGWDQIVVIPSSKSGSTDETMIIFVELMSVLIKNVTPMYYGHVDGEQLSNILLNTLHEVNFIEGRERPAKDLFKVDRERFGTESLIELVYERARQSGMKIEKGAIKKILGVVLGNMFFETTDRPEASRLSAFIRNSGLYEELGEDAPGFGAMFDNVGGRWTADLHMITFLAYNGLNPKWYWESRYNAIKEVRNGTHIANRLGNRILDENITDIALLVPDEVFWFGKAMEQNFNESIWQKGFANLVAIKRSQWEAQKHNYINKPNRLVIDISRSFIDIAGANAFGIANKLGDRSLTKQELAIELGRLFTTFYGMTHTVGNGLIARALAEKGFTPVDVDMSDLDNPATKIVQENLYLRQPYVELGKGLLEARLKALQQREQESPGAIEAELKAIQAAAQERKIESNIPELAVPARISNEEELMEAIMDARQYAEKTGRKFVPFVYLEGDKFYNLRDYLTSLGIEWVMQGTGDQHISYQQVLAQPQKYLPFIISFVPEKVQRARPAIGFAKGYLHNISSNMVRDFFAEASYKALTELRKEEAGLGVFMRMTDDAKGANIAALKKAFTEQLSHEEACSSLPKTGAIEKPKTAQPEEERFSSSGTISLGKISGIPVTLDETGQLHLGKGLVSEPRWSRPLKDAGNSIANPALIKADPDREVYYGFRNVRMKNDAATVDKLKLRFDITVLQPGLIGDEYVMTKGHIHPTMNYPEFYEVWNGRALYLQQGVNPETGKFEVVAAIADKGDKVLLIPGYSHRTVNIGSEPLVMANWISDEVGGKETVSNSAKVKPDFSEIENKNGYAYWVEPAKEGGVAFKPNSKYGEKPADIRFAAPAKAILELGLSNTAPMYSQVNNEALSGFLKDENKKGLDRIYKTAFKSLTREEFTRSSVEVRMVSADDVEGIIDSDVAALETTLFSLSANKEALAKDGKVMIVWDTDLDGTGLTAQTAEKLVSDKKYLGDAVVNVRGAGEKLLSNAEAAFAAGNFRSVVVIAGNKTLAARTAEGRTVGDALRDLHEKSKVLNVQSEDKDGNRLFVRVPAFYNLALAIGYDMGPEIIKQCLANIGIVVDEKGNPIDPIALLLEKIVHIMPIRRIDIDADTRAQELTRKALARSL